MLVMNVVSHSYDYIFFFSSTTFHLSPQIKLSGGNDLEINRSKAQEKLWQSIYILFVLLHIIANMATTSTSNMGMEMCMMDENEINSASQKHLTMAQTTISQKKAKGKLIIESKRPPFWLGFQAMN